MRDTMDFETTPCEEKCENFPYLDGGAKARKEAEAFIRQLRRVFGDCFGTRFRIKSNPYDLPGNNGQVSFYLSIELIFDNAIEESSNYAYNIDENLPAEWDEEAKAELGL